MVRPCGREVIEGDEEEQEPEVSSRTKSLLDEARSAEQDEAKRLTALVSKYADVFTPLPHQIIPEQIVAPSPPKKIVKKRYYLWWFRRSNSKGND